MSLGTRDISVKIKSSRRGGGYIDIEEDCSHTNSIKLQAEIRPL